MTTDAIPPHAATTRDDPAEGATRLRRRWRDEQASRQFPCGSCGVVPDSVTAACGCS